MGVTLYLWVWTGCSYQARCPRSEGIGTTLGHAGTESPRTILGNGVQWPGVGWGSWNVLSKQRVGRAGLGPEYVSFQWSGLREGLWGGADGCAQGSGCRGSWGRGRRGQPQGGPWGPQGAAAQGPRPQGGPIVTRQETASRVSSLSLFVPKVKLWRPQGEKCNIEWWMKSTPGPKLERRTLMD